MVHIVKISFIIHGKIKKIRQLIQKLNTCFSEKYTLDFKITTAEINGTVRSTEALKEGTDCLVAVGGDGTINEVINGYLFFKPHKEVLIGILPFGRGNDLVRSLGITNDQNVLLKSVIHEHYRYVDVGLLTFEDCLQQKQESRYFINISDIGLGGLATQLIRTSSSFFGANWTYFWAIVRSFWEFSAKKVEILSPNWNYKGKVISVCMANGQFFASGLAIAPHAQMDDGNAELVIIGNVGVLDFLGHLSQLRRGELLTHAQIHYHKADRCEIFSESAMPIDIDGEFVGFTPLKMEILPKRVKILVPVLNN